MTGTVQGSTGQPMWLDFHFNTSTLVSRNIRSALFPISIHKFIDGDFGEFGGAVTLSLSKSCTCELCQTGTYKDHFGQSCVPCSPGNYSGVRGSSACRLCAADTFSPSAGASTCKDCPIWETSRPGKAFCKTRPSLPEQPFVVQLSLGSPLEPREFTRAVEGSFRAAIAAAAGVDVMACQITDISAAARRAGGSTVSMEIGAATSDAASNIASGLSTESINAAMSNAGLPGVTILEMGVQTNENFINASTPLGLAVGNSTFWSQEIGPLQMWVWTAAGGGVVLICCCASVALICCRRKRVVDASPEEDETEAVDVVVDESKPRKLEGDTTLTGDLVFQKGEESEEEESTASEEEREQGEEGKEGGGEKKKDSVEPKVPKCNHCGKRKCNPKVKGSIKLQDLQQLKALNDKEGWVVKIFQKKKLCAVELEDGLVVTVQFKNIKCTDPKEMPEKATGGEEAENTADGERDAAEADTSDGQRDAAEAGGAARAAVAPAAQAATKEAGNNGSGALDQGPEHGEGTADTGQ